MVVWQWKLLIIPVFTILHDQPFPDNIEFRDFKGFKQERFKSDLGKENWSSVFNSNELNESYSRFLHIFNKVSSSHAPLKAIKLNNKSCKLWVTSGLLKSIYY